MYHFVNMLEGKILSLECQEIIATLRDAWKFFDNLENQTGREVYINEHELKDFAERDLSF
jgi:hypothetical protein